MLNGQIRREGAKLSVMYHVQWKECKESKGPTYHDAIGFNVPRKIMFTLVFLNKSQKVSGPV